MTPTYRTAAIFELAATIVLSGCSSKSPDAENDIEPQPEVAGTSGAGSTDGARSAGTGGGADNGARPFSGGNSVVAGTGGGSGGSEPLESPKLTNPNLLGTGELGACNAQGWCWQNPAPAGDLFTAISQDGRYAVGENGIVFQWPDRYLPLAGKAALFAVQTVGEVVWVGGYGLWHYDGADWVQAFGDTVRALSATPAGDLWVLLGGVVRHLHAGTWSLEQPAAVQERKLSLLDVIAVDDDTTWALASNYAGPKAASKGGLSVFEFEGGVWSELPTGTEDGGMGWQFVRVGSAVYVYSQSGAAKEVYSPADGWSLVGKAPINAHDGVFAAPGGGMLASGTTGLATVTDQGGERISETRCLALVPTSGTEALCAHPSGGLSLIRPRAALPASEPSEPLGAELFGRVPTAIWAGAYVAWGSSPTDVWRSPVEHFDGSSWTSHADDAPANFVAGVIHGSASDNVWFSGDPEILRYDGTAFHVVPLPEVTGPQGSQPNFVSTLYTLGANDTWMVRGTPDSVKLLHFDGIQWNDDLTINEGSFAYASAAFAGGGSQPLWAAVGHGLYRREGNAWKRELSSNGYSLVDLAVDGAELWALGQDAVYQMVNDELVARGAYSGGLARIALTGEHVWHFLGNRARTLKR